MRKATKTIISFAVVLIAGLNLIVPAFAQDPFSAVAVGIGGASGAGLFGSVGAAMGINTAQSDVNSLDSWWNDSSNQNITISGIKHKGTGQADDPYDYIIVDYTSWSNIRNYVNANTTYYELTDNDSEVFQTNKSYRGYPFNTTTNIGYKVGPSLGTLYTNQTYIVGSASADTNTVINNDFQFKSYYQGNNVDSTWLTKNLIPTNTIFLGNYNNNTYWMRFDGSLYQLICNAGIPGSELSQPTNLTVTTGEIDPFWGDDFLAGAKISIASTPDLSPQFTVEDFLTTLSQYVANNGSIGSGITVEDANPQPVPPTPVPIPDTPLGNVPFDDWVDLWGQGIYQQLENQSDALDFIGSAGEDAVEELESIDTSIQDLGDTAESIDTNIGIGNGILGGIRSLAQSAVNYLEGIAEHVGELVEEIVEGTETLIAGILNQIPQVFSVIFGPIKQASSIWHYVVEWITSIGSPFQFIWSMASGTSYYIILPVYASLAAAVVLAFYKRFGK